MQDVNEAMMVRRALELYHLQLNALTPRTLDRFDTTPFELLNGYYAVSETLPTLLSIFHGPSQQGVIFFYYRNLQVSCSMQLHCPREQRFDDLPFDDRWVLWQQLNAYEATRNAIAQ